MGSRRLLFIMFLATTVGCRAGVRRASGPAAAPANVDVTCQLGRDGAACRFSNRGGLGERCVMLLLGVRGAGSVRPSVYVAPSTCSGALGRGGSKTVAVSFPTLGAMDVCATDRKQDDARCLLRIEPTGSAEEAARVWQDELGEGVAPAPSSRECRALVTRTLRLGLEERSVGASAQERARLEQHYGQVETGFLDDLVRRCEAEVTRQAYDCAIVAGTAAAVRRCGVDQAPDGGTGRLVGAPPR